MVTNEQMLVDSVIKSLKQPPELTDEMIEELQDIFEHYLREKNKKLIEYWNGILIKSTGKIPVLHF